MSQSYPVWKNWWYSNGTRDISLCTELATDALALTVYDQRMHGTHLPPASMSRTRSFGFSDNREARTHPAVPTFRAQIVERNPMRAVSTHLPPPAITTSNSAELRLLPSRTLRAIRAKSVILRALFRERNNANRTARTTTAPRTAEDFSDFKVSAACRCAGSMRKRAVTRSTRACTLPVVGAMSPTSPAELHSSRFPEKGGAPLDTGDFYRGWSWERPRVDL